MRLYDIRYPHYFCAPAEARHRPAGFRQPRVEGATPILCYRVAPRRRRGDLPPRGPFTLTNWIADARVRRNGEQHLCLPVTVDSAGWPE